MRGTCLGPSIGCPAGAQPEHVHVPGARRNPLSERIFTKRLSQINTSRPSRALRSALASFGDLDKFDFVEILDRVPVSIICGTADRLTSIGHSRKLASRIPNARLLECAGAGHMVPLERHDQVNAELDQLITAATMRAASCVRPPSA